jgi:hypothetical protein
MLAYGLAMPLIEGAVFNGQLIPKGYAMVHLNSVKDESKLEFPGDKGTRVDINSRKMLAIIYILPSVEKERYGRSWPHHAVEGARLTKPRRSCVLALQISGTLTCEVKTRRCAR